MGILSRCFCDPFKLTYVSAIVTSIEAVLFAILNIVFICMYKCVIKPPSDVALGFDRFWNYYFYDNQSCIDKDYDPPWWTNEKFPLNETDRSLTTPYDNYVYQLTYLGLHTAWFITALILIYGNGRKLWGYYIPWLLVSTAITVMDITVSAFCITDLVTVTSEQYHSAMFWILVLYFRLFLIFFINMSEFASAFNAFCKARHKRSKQERQRQKLAKAHAEELAKAEAAAEARTRAQMEEEYQRRAQQQYQQQQQPGGYVEMRRKTPPPVPKKPAAPHELRPFSYLNPAFRPNDPTDVEGMRAHSALPEELAMGKGEADGFPQRHGSMRAYSTQAPPPALQRFSSTRVQPGYRGRPTEPRPDYDFTMMRGPSSSGQSKFTHDSVVLGNGNGNGDMLLSFATIPGNVDLPFTSTFPQIHEPYSSLQIPTSTPPTPTTSTPQPNSVTLRHTSLPDILPAQPPDHPSPIIYTKTKYRTHLQIYSSSDVDDTPALQGTQTDRLIFGGVVVPSYSRRVTSYISNSVLKEDGNKDELSPEFWEAQWKSMREGRATPSLDLRNETRQGSLSHALPRSEGNMTRVANEKMEDNIRETTSKNEDLSHIPVIASPLMFNAGDAPSPFKINRHILNNLKNIDNLHHETADSIKALKNETPFKYKSKPLSWHTIAGHKSAKRVKGRCRKLSESYIDVSSKEESSFQDSSLPPRPSSLSSGDMLPDDPAFPILYGVTHLRAH